jgi:hypothetical protein
VVRTIQVIYGKKKEDGKKRKRDKAPIDGIPFKKQSIFYKYLPYWVDLEVRHAIDGMHLKKNVFGNTIGLLLETSAKTKDTLKSRQDLVAMKIRQDLCGSTNLNYTSSSTRVHSRGLQRTSNDIIPWPVG